MHSVQTVGFVHGTHIDDNKFGMATQFECFCVEYGGIACRNVEIITVGSLVAKHWVKIFRLSKMYRAGICLNLVRERLDRWHGRMGGAM